MSHIRGWIRGAAYHSGALTTLHRLRNTQHLTTVMLHRVLPRNSRAWRLADPQYTLPTDVFADCLAFFNDNYSVISLKQLTLARTGGVGLPDHPLLITFDDGWADTLDHAANELKYRKLPAVCFVASDAIDGAQADWWQETFTSAWRHHQIDEDCIARAWLPLGRSAIPDVPGVNAYLRSLMMLQELPETTRISLLKPYAMQGQDAERHMLTADGIRRLIDAGIAVGGHGTTHLPLVMCRDAQEDLSHARQRLGELIAGTGQHTIASLSFPHGRYTDQTVQAARNAGYETMFTSKSVLSQLMDGRPTSDVHGRIEVSLGEISDAAGRFRADRMATLLFHRAVV